jgi:hypothetical protein
MVPESLIRVSTSGKLVELAENAAVEEAFEFPPQCPQRHYAVRVFYSNWRVTSMTRIYRLGHHTYYY